MAGIRFDALLIFYGPSGLGLLLLVVACINAKSWLRVLATGIIAVGLHLLSSLVLLVLVGMGEAWSGRGEAHDNPRAYCLVGLGVLAVPPIIRFVALCLKARQSGRRTW